MICIALSSANYRDIYYAKYYGKGGGGKNGQLGKYIKLRVWVKNEKEKENLHLRRGKGL